VPLLHDGELGDERQDRILAAVEDALAADRDQRDIWKDLNVSPAIGT